MIVEYEQNGRIFHIISDPVHSLVLDMMLQRDSGVLNLPPIPKPLEHERDWDTGELRYNEDGTPKMVSPGVTFQRCDIETDYVFDGAVTPRPVFDLPDVVELVADGVDTRKLTIPDPCDILIDGEPTTISGALNELELAADMPAEYTLEFVQWPYMPKTVKVIAHAAL
ncbi:hypothetical protein [Mesorhizobium sp. M7A.F.Ca.CA.002.12.1.1]|uniref:hypothetical protein n=1 Tax=Mesorhizobium sp. M7A.F.Ca.CA.002.12.1.1 TaxID=2496735 RepID=UPI000FC9B71E|nr:hypothetical protein [Mesorhizobium sp. M7A.F.Ca.CA.002.12.1.1]RUX60156.1 hypothetical protein EN989_11095 [Mesorhizobium sp. M7A.F.Ca.CA.002.12.1.1]